MEASPMREEWKCASMRHGEQFVATFLLGVGAFQRLMLSVNSLDTQQPVRELIYFETIMIFQLATQLIQLFVLEMEPYQ